MSARADRASTVAIAARALLVNTRVRAEKAQAVVAARPMWMSALLHRASTPGGATNLLRAPKLWTLIVDAALYLLFTVAARASRGIILD